MAEGLRGWLQERTAGAGNWVSSTFGRKPKKFEYPPANPVTAEPAPDPVRPEAAQPPATTPVSAPGMSGRAQRRADEIELGPQPRPLDVIRQKEAPATPSPYVPMPNHGLVGPRADAGDMAAGGVAAAGIMGATRDGMRNMAGKAGEWLSKGAEALKGVSARGVGEAAGKAVNMAEAGVDAAKATAADVKAGYQSARPGLAGAVDAEAAKRAAAAAMGPNDGPQISRGMRMLRKVPGIISKAGPALAGVAAGAGALGEASDQMGTAGIAGAMGEQQRGDPMALPKNRMQRLGGMVMGGLRALNPMEYLPSEEAIGNALGGGRGGVRATTPPPMAARPEQVAAQTAAGGQPPAGFDPAEVIRRNDATGLRSGEGVVVNGIAGPMVIGRRGAPFDGRVAPTEEGRRAAALEAAALETQIQANRAIASPEAGGTGVSVGGLRGAPVSAGGSGGRFSGAFRAMAALGAYGAGSRMAKNEADLGLRAQANQTAAAKAALDAQLKREELGMKREELGMKRYEFGNKLRETNETRVNAQLDRAAAEITGGMKKGGWTGGDETADQYKVRKEQDATKFRNSVDYSLRKSGLNVADLTNEQVQGFRDAHKLKARMEAARTKMGQSVRDFFGNKRFDSDDLRSYQPVKAVPANDGGFLIHFANGNTAKVSELQNGGFNWFSPNEPVDADIAAILKPHIDAAKQGKK